MILDLEHRLQSVNQKFQLAADYFCEVHMLNNLLLEQLHTFVTDFTKAKVVILCASNSGSVYNNYIDVFFNNIMFTSEWHKVSTL